MHNYLRKLLICLITFVIPCMNHSVKAMDDEENINIKLQKVRPCQDKGFQKQFCKVANNYGERLLCDYHDEETINNLKYKLETIRKKKAEEEKK